MLKNRIVAAMASTALVCALCPSAALAAPMGAGTVAPQASAVKVAVVSKTTLNGVATKYTYNADGTLARFATAGAGPDGKYTYSGSRPAKYVESGKDGSKKTLSYSYDKKGRVSKQVEKFKTGSWTSRTTTTFSYDAKGRVKATAEKWDDGMAEKHAYTYDKAGRPVKVALKQYVGGKLVNSGSVSMKYDKKGNMSRWWRTSDRDYSTLYDYSNTYKSGRLAKSAISYNRASPTAYTKKLSYKTVSVPKAAAAKVKAQQWAIANPMAGAVYQFPPTLTV